MIYKLYVHSPLPPLLEVDQLITGFSRESLQFEQPPLMHRRQQGGHVGTFGVWEMGLSP